MRYNHTAENKKTRAFGECLGTKRRRRTQHFAKSRGEARAPFDPRISEWGNPPFCTVSFNEYIVKGSERRELKHLSTYRKGNQRNSVSSGERTRTSRLWIKY